MKKINSLTKRFLAVVFAVLMFVSVANVPAYAAEYVDRGVNGVGIVPINATIYTDSTCKNSKGTLEAYKTFTVLSKRSFDASPYVSYEIEYSTSSGRQSGYIKPLNSKCDIIPQTTIATITSNVDVYFGKSPVEFQLAGKVYANETVGVLSEFGGWAYIEYNTTTGRKRGFIDPRFLGTHGSTGLDNWPFIRNTPGVPWEVQGDHTIYSGPLRTFSKVGEVFNGENVTLHQMNKDSNGNYTSIFITYNTPDTNQLKSGYIVYNNYYEVK